LAARLAPAVYVQRKTPEMQKAHQPKLMGFFLEFWWEVQVSNLMSWRCQSTSA